MLPGSGAIIFLGGTSPDEMVVVSKSSLYSELTVAERVYPNTVIGVMAKWRELYRQASLTKTYESTYASNRTGIDRPSTDRVLEAFYPVIDKRLPVLFRADKALDLQRVLALQKDLGFSLIAVNLHEAWDIIPKLKSAGVKPFLSLDLPEEKKEDKKDDKSTDSPFTDSLERKALEKRRAETVALHSGQASAFQKAGVQFGFSTLNAKTKDIPSNMRRIIKAGLTEDQALAALTTSPASLLGLTDRLGSIDAGKVANLVISRKPYFDEKSKVQYVFVDGVMYKVEAKESDKPGEKKTDKP
jgi:imidazolonepropionase-like amidohydrolase